METARNVRFSQAKGEWGRWRFGSLVALTEATFVPSNWSHSMGSLLKPLLILSAITSCTLSISCNRERPMSSEAPEAPEAAEAAEAAPGAGPDRAHAADTDLNKQI